MTALSRAHPPPTGKKLSMVSPLTTQNFHLWVRSVAMKSVLLVYKFLIDSCELVAYMAWRRRWCRALRFGDSYL
jgi:hypothetical protein